MQTGQSRMSPTQVCSRIGWTWLNLMRPAALAAHSRCQWLRKAAVNDRARPLSMAAQGRYQWLRSTRLSMAAVDSIGGANPELDDERLSRTRSHRSHVVVVFGAEKDAVALC